MRPIKADLIIPAHASAKNCALLGGDLLPLHTLRCAAALKERGTVREVVVVTNIADLIAAAEGAGFAVFNEPDSLATNPQIAPVCAAATRQAKELADYVLVLCPNVPFRDPARVEAFLRWAQELHADTAWTCEAVPCRAEMIVFDHQKRPLVEQAIPGDQRSADRRLVLCTHYAVAARTEFLLEHEMLRPSSTALYQMPHGHVTWSINHLSDLEWAERML